MADLVLDRLDELTTRLSGVEHRLGLMERILQKHPVQTAPPRAVPPPMPKQAPITLGTGDVSEEPLEAEIIPAPLPKPPAVAWGVTTPVAPPASRAKPEKTLETLIGQNWTSWVGAIVVVLGVLFFLKYAWDQGWLAMSPGARVVTAIIAGIGFEIAGVWVDRRKMRVLAGTLTGAGVAIIMAAFFAGHTLFEPPVISTTLAFAGVCAAAAVGIWRGLRMNVMSLAIVALLGAYLAPAILRSGHDESLSLVIYLGTLAAVGWTLAYLKPRWDALRWFVWVCSAVWVGAWIVWYPMRGTHRPLAMIAVGYLFAGFMAEAFFSLHRALRIKNENEQGKVSGWAENLDATLALFSMLTTGATFIAWYGIVRGTSWTPTGWLHLDAMAGIALGLAALHAMLAWATPGRMYGRSSVLLAAALVTLAVPLALGQVAITLVWMVMAVALAALRRERSAAARYWAMALLALALGRLMTLDAFDDALREVVLWIGPNELTWWLLLAWAGAVAAHGVGWLIESETVDAARLSSPKFEAASPRGWGCWLSVIGTAVFVVAGGMSWHGIGLTLLWTLGAGILVGLARWGRRMAYAEQAAAVLALAGLKWLTSDGLQPMLANWDHPIATLWPVVNSMALAGTLIAAGLFAIRRWTREEMKIPAAVAAGVLLFALANFETLRTVDYFSDRFADFATAKVVALSLLWGVTGLAAVMVGFAKRLEQLRYAALGLLGLTLLKILFVDLAHVRPVYRILSFLVVGVLLLCVSFVYHRQQTERAG